MHLIKTERPQEVIQKSLHGLMTDLGLGNVLSQKISCFAAKHFTKVTYFSQMKKRKNIKMLILSRLFHLRFRCSLKNVVIL